MVWVAQILPALVAVAITPGATAFNRYPATVSKPVPPAAPLLKDALSRRYRSALDHASKSKPNFAGHYILTQIGCGAGCVQIAVIDRATGDVVWFPSTVSGGPLSLDQPLSFRQDSRLLIVQGMLDERPPSRVHQYFFKGGRFQLLAPPQ